MEPSTRSDRSPRPDPEISSAADEDRGRQTDVNVSAISDTNQGWRSFVGRAALQGISYLFGEHNDPLRGVVTEPDGRTSSVPADLFGDVRTHVSVDPPEENSPDAHRNRRVGGASSLSGGRSPGPPVDEVFAVLDQEREQKKLVRRIRKLERKKLKKEAAAPKADGGDDDSTDSAPRHASNNGGVPFEAEASTIPHQEDIKDFKHDGRRGKGSVPKDPEAAAVTPDRATRRSRAVEVSVDDQRVGALLDNLEKGNISSEELVDVLRHLTGHDVSPSAEIEALATRMAKHESKHGALTPRRKAIDADAEKQALHVQRQLMRDPNSRPAALNTSPRRKKDMKVAAKKALATLVRDDESSGDESLASGDFICGDCGYGKDDCDCGTICGDCGYANCDGNCDASSNGSSDGDSGNGWSGSYDKSFVASEDDESCDSEGFKLVTSRKKSNRGGGANGRTPSKKKLTQLARRSGQKVSKSASKPESSGCSAGCNCALKQDQFLPSGKSATSTVPTFASYTTGTGTSPDPSEAVESEESEESEEVSGEFTESSDRHDLRNADLIESSTPNVSFLSLGAAKLREMTYDIVPGLELTTAETEVAALERLVRTATGYQDQRDRMVGQGSSKPKSSELLTPFAHDLSVESKASLSAEKKEDIVSHYNQNTERFDNIAKHCIRFDLREVCYVFAVLPGVDINMSLEKLRSTPLEKLIDLKKKAKYIWEAWASLTVDEVGFMQRLLNYHPQMQITVRDSNSILFKYLHNMQRQELRTTVDRTYDKAFADQERRGALTYAFALLRKVNCGTAATRLILDSHRKKICETGPSFFNNGENMAVIQEYFVNIILDPLTAMDHFGPSEVDFLKETMKFLAKSSCPAFAKPFEEKMQARTLSKVTSGGILTYSSRDQRTSIEKSNEIKDLLDEAVTLYDLLMLTSEYTTSKGKSLNAFVSSRYEAAGCKCFNCGEPGHSVKDCKDEKNEARIAANKKKYDEEKAAKKSNGGVPKRDPSGNNGGGGAGGGNGNRQQKSHMEKKKGGKTYVAFKCMKCGGDNGRWTNHTTKHHKKALEDTSFCMSKASPQHAGSELMKEKKLKSYPLQKDKDDTKAATAPKSADAREAWKQYKKEDDALAEKQAIVDPASDEYADLSKERQVLTAAFEAAHFQ
jgi:hypothetical protein